MTKQTETTQARVKVFKALADPIRLEIIRYLNQLDHGVSCGEVDRAMQIGKTSGSYHFKILQAAGLITTHKVAREKYVALDRATFDQYLIQFWQDL
ncbi:winged helix-turn-helix domain-containing protein [Lactiplantibacillus sp. WILCCON 0030]|uniref:Winged helix-turn-helix domain-containing protein n=1 Tax=Lactiplantibacillus brownii TaxID=3069269 RepID=A0ABU1ADJ9_9LACO|nr:winged helix-turn-helix domain-containing protein [Lactiplantibacillus brownii]MDQ7938390.1 winged helix-turn-helix domain-containing protein [Lactiplantibacillus brownii]